MPPQFLRKEPFAQKTPGRGRGKLNMHKKLGEDKRETALPSTFEIPLYPGLPAESDLEGSIAGEALSPKTGRSTERKVTV